MKKFVWLLVFIYGFNAFSNALQPTLSNFRIIDNEPTKVYFDSNVEISGSTFSGFIIGSNSIKSIKIIRGSTNGHYFTVSEPFTFWDNNLIRYEGGSNIKSINNQQINPFSVTYIQNNVKEPKAIGRVYYVTKNGNDSNSGLEENKSWRTITYAAMQAKAGDVVYVKSGDYGKEKVVIKNYGSPEKPIKFIGYTDRPGDMPKLTRQVDLDFDSTLMPLIRDGSGNGITCVSKSYIIIRNFQIENYDNWGIKIDNSNFVMIDNVYLKELLIGIRTVDKYSTNNRVINSYIANCKNSAVRLDNKNNLLDNVWAVSSKVVNMDYYLSINGGISGENNTIRNCYVERFADDSHGGHGYTFKAGDPANKIRYSLVENSEVVNCGGAIEFRHSGVKFNVARNVKIRETKKGESKGIKIRESASFNLIENCDVSGEMGVRFDNNKGEDLGDQIAGSNNRIVNSVFHDLKFAVFVNGGLPQNRNNEFVNCTFFNIKNLYSQASGDNNNKFDQTNKFINCAFEDISNKVLYGKPSFILEHSNFWNFWNKNGDVSNDSSNISVKSSFKNSESRNFRLQSTSLLIDAGKKIDNLTLDCDQKQRPQGISHDIGAFEYFDNTNVDVLAYAGEDESICLGESVTLTASGGSKYLWSTNQETASISVSPSKTTTYSVIVSNGSSEATDQVTVTVNEVNADAGEDVYIAEGETTTLTATGGDKYEWDNGETSSSITVNPEVTKSYNVTVYYNGCSSTDEVIVNVTNTTNPKIIADAGEDISICKGEEVVLTASGGDNYEWSSGQFGKSIKVSPDVTTTYSVIVTKGSLKAVDQVSVTVNEVIADAGEDVQIEVGSSITLTANGGDSYLWSTGENSKSITVSPIETTVYTVKIKKGECSSEDSVEVSTHQNDNNNQVVPLNINNHEIYIYPNPAAGILNVDARNIESELEIHLINTNGQVLFYNKINSDNGDILSEQLNFQRFEKGVYYVRFTNLYINEVKKIVLI